MPGIKLNFKFDIKAFEKIIDDSNFALNHPFWPLRNNQTETVKSQIQQRLEYCLESFDSTIKGNTKIAHLRTSLYEAIYKANPRLFATCKGVDLWFNNKLLDGDSQTIIDIVGLWNNSVIIITPSNSVLHFIDAFLNHTEFPSTNVRPCFHSLIWNALNESVKKRNLTLWDMFCAAILQHWNENKRYFDYEARIFLQYLLQFDPCPLREYCGWKLMNVVMGTGLSQEILQKLMEKDTVLWEADCHGSNALMHCVLENDIQALDYIMEFGINLDDMIDEINTINDFIMIYGSVEMSFMSQDFNKRLIEKKEIIVTHDTFLKEGIPMDLVNEIGSFLLGTDIMKSVNNSEEEKDEEKVHDTIFDEIEQSIKIFGNGSVPVITTSNEYPSTSGSIEIISASERQQSSANNLYEIEQRLSVISCSSN